MISHGKECIEFDKNCSCKWSAAYFESGPPYRRTSWSHCNSTLAGRGVASGGEGVGVAGTFLISLGRRKKHGALDDTSGLAYIRQMVQHEGGKEGTAGLHLHCYAHVGTC